MCWVFKRWFYKRKKICTNCFNRFPTHSVILLGNHLSTTAMKKKLEQKKHRQTNCVYAKIAIIAHFCRFMKLLLVQKNKINCCDFFGAKNENEFHANIYKELNKVGHITFWHAMVESRNIYLFNFFEFIFDSTELNQQEIYSYLYEIVFVLFCAFSMEIFCSICDRNTCYFGYLDKIHHNNDL